MRADLCQACSNYLWREAGRGGLTQDVMDGGRRTRGQKDGRYVREEDGAPGRSEAQVDGKNSGSRRSHRTSAKVDEREEGSGTGGFKDMEIVVRIKNTAHWVWMAEGRFKTSMCAKVHH